MTNWRKLIEAEMEGSSWRDGTGEKIEDLTFHDPHFDLDEEFDDGYGAPTGLPFTAWGPNFVYFPICYDGAEWCGSAPRFPCDVATPHMGGG